MSEFESEINENGGDLEHDSSIDENVLDPKSQERFISHFVNHQRAIHSFIQTIVPSTADADEILQESSLTMWRKFDQFQEGTNFRNWAFQISKFTAFNHLRRLKRDRLVFGETLMEMISVDIQRNESQLASRRVALRHCISKLAEKDASVLVGCYSSSQSINEYSDSVGRTANAIYKQLDRIRKDLYVCIRRAAGELST